jgi:transcription antitermination factor NusG
MLRPHPQNLAGERVRVRAGVFAGLEGRVAELRQECRVVLSLNGINQHFSLEIDRSDIEVLKPH